MNIGIVGLGVVGSALSYGFKSIGHTVLPHDIKMDTKLSDLLNTEVVYLCVPTPSREDGACDTSIVEQCIKDLHALNYRGIVAIKSTVPPGTTQRIQEGYSGEQICIVFVPEFLRERCAIYDFVENNTLLAIGASEGCSEAVEVIIKSHGYLPKQVSVMSSSEAELLKYYSNVFNAMRIIFANEIYEVAKSVGADYTKVKEAFIKYSGIQDIYLNVNDNFRGYAGVCLPKDVKAMAFLCKEKGLNMNLFQTLDTENDKFVKTAFEGMRK